MGVIDAPSARADDAEKPWARGVSKERRAKAQALLERGNTAFLANRFKEALELYEEAVAAWDHPAIRFNAVRALVPAQNLHGGGTGSRRDRLAVEVLQVLELHLYLVRLEVLVHLVIQKAAS